MQDITTIYQGVMDFIKQAIAVAQSEPVADMDALNQKVEELTTTINELPLEKRMEYRGELGALFDALRELETTLTDRRSAIQGELGSQPHHRAANAAYSKINTIDDTK